MNQVAGKKAVKGLFESSRTGVDGPVYSTDTRNIQTSCTGHGKVNPEGTLKRTQRPQWCNVNGSG